MTRAPARCASQESPTSASAPKLRAADAHTVPSSRPSQGGTTERSQQRRPSRAPTPCSPKIPNFLSHNFWATRRVIKKATVSSCLRHVHASAAALCTRRAPPPRYRIHPATHVRLVPPLVCCRRAVGQHYRQWALAPAAHLRAAAGERRGGVLEQVGSSNAKTG